MHTSVWFGIIWNIDPSSSKDWTPGPSLLELWWEVPESLRDGTRMGYVGRWGPICLCSLSLSVSPSPRLYFLFTMKSRASSPGIIIIMVFCPSSWANQHRLHPQTMGKRNPSAFRLFSWLFWSQWLLGNPVTHILKGKMSSYPPVKTQTYFKCIANMKKKQILKLLKTKHWRYICSETREEMLK